jgi:hypothetical protein
VAASAPPLLLPPGGLLPGEGVGEAVQLLPALLPLVLLAPEPPLPPPPPLPVLPPALGEREDSSAPEGSPGVSVGEAVSEAV